MSLYVYGVVAPGHPVPAGPAGVGAGPVRLLTTGPQAPAAVVGDAPAGLRARRRDLTAHQELLVALAADGPVLPMRFGVVLPDEAVLLDQLATRRSAYERALERVAGRVEMNVKALPPQGEAALAQLLAEDVGLRAMRDRGLRRPGYEASVRLGQAVSDALERRARLAAERVRRALVPLAAQWCDGPQVEGCVLNVSLLLDRDAEAAFRAESDRLAAALAGRAELLLTGPLPCYSFVPAEAAGSPAPHRAAV
ncbi:GvpL/GvpF family gas vesicle protein [Streptomyces albidoflavus]|uniref:GvpL/GvpF family gas vesicle protein n=1 Tax=Streptomyces albidoflavus TaxID=1886 RepID=UPI001C475B29|nr:GvpL/GvpF family gas vesicle protein [Streptomyces albidoflavus]MBV7648292.1 GvpL/GvpF family gas vesicle protein [Streptomyces albidoflavus]MBV7709751.1 GvpL/GvpF family gas vesicle protein [Streptomyces albidoflavus]